MASIIVPNTQEVFDILEEYAYGLSHYIANETSEWIEFEADNPEDLNYLQNILPVFHASSNKRIKL